MISSFGASCVNVLGFVNGMIGGAILVLPVMGLQAGYITTPIICIAMGFITFYTCWLQVLHVGQNSSIKESILAHFNQNYTYVVLYGFLTWAGVISYLVISFRLIILQVQYLLGESYMIAPFCALVVFLLIFVMKLYKIDDFALAFGAICIAAYMIFVIWALVSAPEGENQIAPFGGNVGLESTLMVSFSAINMVSQNLFKLPNREDYGKIVGVTFLIGSLANTFFIYGCYAIVNRTPLKPSPETIEDYFEKGGWQNSVIEILFLFQLLSIFPNLVLITKVRFYDIFRVQLNEDHFEWGEFFYQFAVVMMTFLIFQSGVNLQTLFKFTGSVFCYLNMIIVPIVLHLKCVFFDKSSGRIEGDKEYNLQIEPNSCRCQNTYSSKWILYLETFSLISICIFGFLLMGDALIEILTE